MFVSVWAMATHNVASVTDSSGDSFTELGYSVVAWGGGNIGLAIYAAYDVAGGTSVTVNVVLSGSSHLDAAVNVVDATGVATTPLAQFGSFTNSTQSGQTNRLFDNEIPTSANDLVLAGVSSHNAATWSASGGDTNVENEQASISGVTISAADFQYTATSPGSVWMNGTSSIGYSQWVADSLALGPAAATPTQYPVDFTESGLSSGTSWTVTLAGSTNSTNAPGSNVFPEANGSYAFSVGTVVGYSASPASGTVTVNGGAVTESITFVALPPTQYPVSFAESGLPGGTSWAVTLAGSTNSTDAPGSNVFSEVNGSYAFSVGTIAGYSAAPASGTVTVNGAGVSETITFSPVPPNQYSLEFTESGLPSGTPWSVTLAGSINSTTAPGSNVFQEPNGSYAFSIGTVAGYSPTPASGTVAVSGGAVTEPITFVPVPPVPYPVNFTESGLPSGTSWTVTLAGSVNSTVAPGSNDFQETNGSYTFSVGAIAGYSSSPASGTVTVSGLAVIESITFSPTPPTQYPVDFTESGLSSGTSWTVTLAGSTNSTNAPGSNVFPEANGSYAFSVGTVVGYSASPASGTVTVNGGAVTESITFVALPPTQYPVSFAESGLPGGTSWAVTLAGSTNSTDAPGSNVFSEVNGSYAFSVGTIAGYSAAPASGTVTVNGAGVSETITFTPSSSTHDITHVVLIYMENEELSTLLQYAPYQSYLYHTYGIATNFYAACHDSPHDYIIATSGRDFGCPAPIPKENVTNIADLMQGSGLTWAGYFESLPASDYCGAKSVGLYYNYHNPFQYYSDIVQNASPTRCDNNVLNSASFNSTVANGSLPTFSLYVPNSCDDGDDPCGGNGSSHQSLTAQGDAWMQSFLAPILNHTGKYDTSAEEGLIAHTAFFITYDEGTTKSGYNNGYVMAPGRWSCNGTVDQTACAGQIPLIVVSPYSEGTNFTSNADQVQILSTIEWLFGLPSDGGQDSPSIASSNLFPPMTSLFSFPSNGYVPANASASAPAPFSGTPPPAPRGSAVAGSISAAALGAWCLGIFAMARWGGSSPPGGREHGTVALPRTVRRPDVGGTARPAPCPPRRPRRSPLITK